ncbi:nucleoside hydrolase [Elioraea thermophila]|uniref:nucleoside hydrolase n=1 Tax=Elioraea thermophila TaxID=2185104 RepID=UPI000DF17080|nr:nucleoside hydrolase [Elioraea thermophila]
MTAALPLALDCDPGVDDALALLLACAAPSLALRLVTTVSGNAPASVCAANARRLLDLAGRAEVPVIAGEDRAVPDAVVHGADGLRGLDLPPPSRPPDGTEAAAALAGFDGILVALGPLTNLARALAPGARWRRLVVMGGAIGPGNTPSGAEYNFAADPAAAAAVLAAGLRPTLVPLDLAREALATPERIEALARACPIGRRIAPMLAGYAEQDRFHHGLAGAMVADLHAVAILDRPDLYATRPARIAVDEAGRCREDTAAPMLDLVVAVKADALFAHLAERLARLSQA